MSPALYRLMTWLSPAFPVGAYSHSHGLEWAIEAGWIAGRADLIEWLQDLLTQGSGWTDAVLFVHGHRAALAGDELRLLAVADLAVACQPARERLIEATAQGEAFRRAVDRSWSAGASSAGPLLPMVESGRLALPLAVAAQVARHGIEAEPGLTAYLLAFVANLVTAAQRLVPLGQSDGQDVLAALEPILHSTVDRALSLPDAEPFDQIGSAAWRSDLAAMLHESQYTRLFRT
jgi:urease accessory protein